MNGANAMSSRSICACVNLVIHDSVAEISFSNGPLNLVTKQLLVDLNRALVNVSRQSEVRCLILHGGTARAFCAGSDIKEFTQLAENASEQKILFEDMVVRQLARIPMPSIAALDGHALGGGLELALACDLRVCKPGVKLGLTESRLGGLAGSGALRITRLLGPAKAKELLFTGDILSAEESLAIGLVNQIAESGSALDAARVLARKIAMRGPLSNRLAKELVDLAFDAPLDAALVRSTVAQQRIFDSQDLHEGVAAFFSKRDPEFAGA